MEGRFGTDNKCTLTVEFFALVGSDNHQLASVTFNGTTQDNVYGWINRIIEAHTDFQRYLLPVEFEIDHVKVTGMQYLADGEGSPVEWWMMASKPGQVLFPPFDDQGREVV